MVQVHREQHLIHAGDINPEKWLAHIKQNHPKLKTDLIKSAIQLIEEKKSHETLILGLLIAANLIHFCNDENCLAAALYYPTAEAFSEDEATVKELLSPTVAGLVAGAQKMEAIHALKGVHKKISAQEQIDKLRKMLLAMIEDVRVVLIKLVEHLVLLRDAKDQSEQDKILLAEEAQEIYAPLANRLGIAQIKWEMEDLSFRYLQPKAYQHIAKCLDEKRLLRETYLEEVITLLNDSLAKEDIKAEVHGRAKHIYSIWRKMQRKNLDYTEIYDVRAVRILVDTVQQCYGALGIVHHLWQHIPKEFDDYIASPKENGYQSLHTAVFGPEGKIVEVQIRTHDMHEASELGVASHWRYKEGVSHDDSYEQKIAWLRQLLDWQAEVGELEANRASLQTDLLLERIYVFTPQGKVVDLAQGATPLDFAYCVHTQVGHRARGAKVRGKMVPFTYQLKTGDVVEILTSKDGAPSRDWLNPELHYIKTSRARAKIHAWFREQDKDKNLHEGKESMERELHRLNISPPNYEKIAGHFNLKSEEQLLIAVGAGDLRPLQILHAAKALPTPPKKPEIKVRSEHHPKTSSNVTILGIGNMLTKTAKCCKPLPGEAIIGYVTQGSGVSIHRQDCPNIAQAHMLKEQRLLEVEWGNSATTTYPVDIKVTAIDRKGLLGDIGNLLNADKINVTDLNTATSKEESLVSMHIRLEVPNLEALSTLLDKINNLPNILSARRIK